MKSAGKYIEVCLGFASSFILAAHVCCNSCSGSGSRTLELSTIFNDAKTPAEPCRKVISAGLKSET